MNETDLKDKIEFLIEQYLKKIPSDSIASSRTERNQCSQDHNASCISAEKEHYLQSATREEGTIEDITKIDLKKQFLVEDAKDKDGYLDMKSRTPARLGMGKAGARYKAITMLRMRADHAAAQDAVFSYVPEEFVEKNGYVAVETLCKDKDEFITRPDLGRRFSQEMLDKIKNAVGPNPKVVLVVGDGLSSSAITANAQDIIPAVRQGLSLYGIDAGKVIFVKHSRVGVMDDIGDATGAEVVCIFIGERPGLVTAQSMSAYICYKPHKGIEEAKRTVISNIHKGGTPAVEAGAHIAELIKKMLDKKASGIDLKQREEKRVEA